MKLNVGVLVIGSLYWDKHQTRTAWRESLQPDGGWIVNAPIRYGRRSETWGGAYTMVFSSNCKAGTARVLRCKDISSADDLFGEADRLWAAERKAPSNGHFSAAWGRVGLLVNEKLPPPQQYLDAWADRVRKEPVYRQIEHDKSVLDKNGLLRFAWPELIDTKSPVPLHLLLATATEPNPLPGYPVYPNPEKVAAAWGAQKEGHVSYFRNNRANGIYTFEDEAILEALRLNYPDKAMGIV